MKPLMIATLTLLLTGMANASESGSVIEVIPALLPTTAPDGRQVFYNHKKIVHPMNNVVESSPKVVRPKNTVVQPMAPKIFYPMVIPPLFSDGFEG